MKINEWQLWFYQGVWETVVQSSLPFLGILLAAWLGFRLGKTTKRESDLREDQLQLVPMLHGFIKEAGSHHAPILVWRNSKDALEKRIWRFRMHLSGRRKKAFCKAWVRLEQTRDAELYANTPTGDFDDNGSVEDLQKAQRILTARLNDLLKSIENS
jgi:hypothetical protein